MGCESHRYFYMSVAPQLAPVIAQKLHKAKLCDDPARSRMVFEKPFGHDLESANALNGLLCRMFKEEQIYRIDHYLGKETVQNILALRFANALFEPVWNNHYIEHVQITAAETVAWKAAAPITKAPARCAIWCKTICCNCCAWWLWKRRYRLKPMKSAIKKWTCSMPSAAFRKTMCTGMPYAGSTGRGWMKGEEVRSYRAGKRRGARFAHRYLCRRAVFCRQLALERRAVLPAHRQNPGRKNHAYHHPVQVGAGLCVSYRGGRNLAANRLTISIQPQMDIRLRFQAKHPGPHMTLQPVDMTFSYAAEYGDNQPEAYETLLQDVIEGDPRLFMRGDQVEAAWQIITPILELWQEKQPVDFPNYYAPGTWGPEDAEALIAKNGHHWVTLPVPWTLHMACRPASWSGTAPYRWASKYRKRCQKPTW
jgi:glucose-6-phosphate 1-dehydrogenase